MKGRLKLNIKEKKKVGFFEKVNKVDKLLAKLMKRRGRR
jgi:hypothetical protein